MLSCVYTRAPHCASNIHESSFAPEAGSAPTLLQLLQLDGGFPTIRHNEIRDLTANLMSEVCHDVCVEPGLQPVTGEILNGASGKTEDGTRLDIAGNGFWGDRHEPAYFDMRVFQSSHSFKQTTVGYLLQKAREREGNSL